ncbi:MAG: hypothetical protein ACQEXV_22495 [Bacillota bacterium]
MIYSFRSKHNLQEIKVQLTNYLGHLFERIRVAHVLTPRKGYPLQHKFYGVHNDTGELYLFRVTYKETETWGKRSFHCFRVECMSDRRGSWFDL